MRFSYPRPTRATDLPARPPSYFNGYDVGVNLILYAAATIVRGCIVSMVWYAESRLGRRMDWKDAIVTTWGGLRGAVGLALYTPQYKFGTTCCALHAFASRTRISAADLRGWQPTLGETPGIRPRTRPSSTPQQARTRIV